ncbi:hypothetical protein GWI33_004969 [Rhynchophorus ferrugineus]|uniref:Uncharacterized protein n=1 Tax=Rhynchophorus ferrugineus TaxID=354439 RepID=A0A834MID3_RHYFE|nr:hypothetical protein GWI33_004969 [Rhynchophorus ferrugineus]
MSEINIRGKLNGAGAEAVARKKVRRPSENLIKRGPKRPNEVVLRNRRRSGQDGRSGISAPSDRWGGGMLKIDARKGEGGHQPLCTSRR